ncbi:LysR family transcriptional regulator [Paenibacillus camerounensis]|uniref:LysR family transcriptional regulator n=1 Tax=Paenibacillus camerounensis TaxID=1243663 RepID=UPI0005AAF45C|nr:LysR family transcriptional regulator [Paenibacillus camerounensis]
MELLQLQYFVTVARLEHVTEAAQSLHVTQSSLSRTIARLEEDLGVPLFDRNGRRLKLNEYGSRFLQRAERALFELNQGRQELQSLASLEPDTLELAVTAASTLPNILRVFRQKRPDIRFHVQMLTTREMTDCLQRGEVDFCLSSPAFEAEEIETRIVYIDPLLVAVPKGHRLAERSVIGLAELKDEPFVGVKKGYGTRDLADSVCGAEGFTPHYVYEGDEPSRLIQLVEAEIGIAFIPGTAQDVRGAVSYLQVDNGSLVREIALLWNKGRYLSPAACDFREVVTGYFAGLQ